MISASFADAVPMGRESFRSLRILRAVAIPSSSGISQSRITSSKGSGWERLWAKRLSAAGPEDFPSADEQVPAALALDPDLVTFPAGTSCVWKIARAVRKHYRFG